MQCTAMDGNVARRVLETRLRELEQRARLESFRLKALTDEDSTLFTVAFVKKVMKFRVT